MNIILYNKYNYHYETFESIITKYDKILNIKKNPNNKFFLYIVKNKSFEKYMKEKYPKIKFIHKFFNANYIIDCTIYERDKNKIIKNSNKYFYISHDVIPEYNKLNNVFYLTPIGQKYIIADILPLCFNKNLYIKTKIPIFVIQGNFTSSRRDYSLLRKILNTKFNYDYRIKLLGRGKPPINHPKIIVKKNLDFLNYHLEFLNIYCIIPLISKDSHPLYYNKKLTSTMSYTYAYNLNILIDKDLQNIYKHKKAFVYNDKSDFIEVFKKCLKHFYDNK